MIPIFWRYLLQHYFKVLFLVIVAFIAILLVSRLQEIATFATIGASPWLITRFVLYQIPYILPIAIPISALLSSIILFQRLSHTQEITALRAGSISLRHILSPLLIAASLLSLLNFYISSELATSSHLATRQMAFELSSVNPLVLLQNSKIGLLKGAYVEMEPERTGEKVSDLLIALQHPSTHRLALLLAESAEMQGRTLHSDGVTLISTTPGQEVIVEREVSAESPASEMALLLRRKGWKIAADHLTFSLLRVRAKDPAKGGAKCYTEMVRRIALGLAPLTFTLMGMAFGLEISRRPSKRGIVAATALSALSLIAFFAAKEFDHLFLLAASLFLLPHVLIAGASLRSLRRLSRGIEG